MATGGGEGCGLSVAGHGLLRLEVGGDRLEGHAEDHRRAVADAALDAAGAVGRSCDPLAVADEVVVVGGAPHAGAVEAAARLEPFAGRQRKHGSGQLGLELAEDRFAPAGGESPRHAADGASDRVAFAARRQNLGLHGRGGGRIGAAHSGAVDLRAGYADCIDAAANARNAAHPGDDLHAELLPEQLLRDGAGHHTSHRLAGARPSAAARVAMAVLGLVGVVGV